MMDKIVVTAADIEKLLAWRDEHNDLVRSMPVPLREVEIQIVESGISIKCFRSDKKPGPEARPRCFCSAGQRPVEEESKHASCGL